MNPRPIPEIKPKSPTCPPLRFAHFYGVFDGDVLIVK
jgi:hypothetical protein